jgi:hypothetical protein
MNRLAKITRALSPHCREAIRLQSDALERPLPELQRIGLRIHLALCIWCSRYGKQIKFLRTATQHCDHDREPKQGLPAGARERIKQALEAGKKATALKRIENFDVE